MNNWEISSIISGGALTLIALKDIFLRADKSIKWYKRISPIGYICLLLTVVLVTGSILKDDKPQQDTSNSPLVFLSSNRSQINTVNGSIEYLLSLVNQSKRDAFNLKVKLASMGVKNGEWTVHPIRSFSTESLAIDKMYSLKGFAKGNSPIMYDTLYFYLKGSYSKERNTTDTVPIEYVIYWYDKVGNGVGTCSEEQKAYFLSLFKQVDIYQNF